MGQNPDKLYLFLNGIDTTPSTRLRWLNYIEMFHTESRETETIISGPLFYRLSVFHKIPRGAVLLIQKKLLTLPELVYLKMKMGRLVFDIDDTIWLSHPTRGNRLLRALKQFYKSRVLMQGMRFYDRIICANEVLAETVSRFNGNITVVPTSPSDGEEEYDGTDDKLFRIVWTGTHSNLYYLDLISGQMKEFLEKHSDVELCVISDGEYSINGLKRKDAVRNISWTVENESLWIQRSSLGIMPLSEDEWSRGKSAFKLIKYMKLHLPVVATDFGFQKDMIRDGSNGFLVDNKDWLKRLEYCYSNRPVLESIAEEGFKTYEDQYSPRKIFDKYRVIFDSLK